jgi:hypothetical protein
LKLDYAVPLMAQGLSPEAQKKLDAAQKVIKPGLGNTFFSLFCITPEESKAIWALAGLSVPQYAAKTEYVEVEIPDPPTALHAVTVTLQGLDGEPLKHKTGILQADNTVIEQDEPLKFNLTFNPDAKYTKPPKCNNKKKAKTPKKRNRTS